MVCLFLVAGQLLALVALCAYTGTPRREAEACPVWVCFLQTCVNVSRRLRFRPLVEHGFVK